MLRNVLDSDRIGGMNFSFTFMYFLCLSILDKKVIPFSTFKYVSDSKSDLLNF